MTRLDAPVNAPKDPGMTGAEEGTRSAAGSQAVGAGPTPVEAGSTSLRAASDTVPGGSKPRRLRRLAGPTAPWIGVALSAGLVLGWTAERLVPGRPEYSQPFSPDWLPLVAAAVALVAMAPLSRPRGWLQIRGAMRWAGVLLLVWAANGLPFDLLAAAGLLGHRTASGEIVLTSADWPGLATRAFALATAIALARLRLPSRTSAAAGAASRRPASWYAYAAFVFALPYPVLRMHWALGGTLGISSPGAAGQGWEPLILAIPWLAAAVLSLLLVSPRRRVPRRLLLAGGWTATAIVAMIGPAATWSIVQAMLPGGHADTGDIALWVFALFYGSWLLFAIAEAAATRSYQLRTAPVGARASI